jgi:hypothetical protein
MSMEEASYIWNEPDGRGRNRYVLFRRTFELKGEPEAGQLSIFADTRYRLLINGMVVAHGPARFLVEAPEYDTHDITPFLRSGHNVVAVMVNSYGCVSFHSEFSRGGLKAWGTVQTADGAETTLVTDESWKCIESPGHRPETAKLSFALNPGELLDAREVDPDWASAACDDSGWAAAVPVADPSHWGDLHPRSIPLLDERRVEPEGLTSVRAAAWCEDDEVYSFALAATGGRYRRRGLPALAMAHLHSPREQDVTLGAWWGEYWLNGEKLDPRERDDVHMRQDFPVHLREGWNTLLVRRDIDYGVWLFYLGVPRDADVSVSAERELGSPYTFLLAGPWEGEPQELNLPLESPDALPRDLGPWQRWPRGLSAEDAYTERAWKTSRLLEQEPDEIAAGGADYAREVGQDTLVLLYDFGGEVLGRPVIEFTAAEGTRVDLAYSERLEDGEPADMRRHHVCMAERYIARGGRQEWRTFHPRGMRWLEVSVTGDLDAFELHEVAMTRANYPVRNIGSFECSDPLLNRIWRIGRATQHACMEDAYLDCPRRERGLYSGDFLVQFYTNLAAYGDTKLMRRCIELFFLSQGENGFVAPGAHGLPPGRHPDYTAILVQALWQYYARTGDVEFLRQMEPRLRKLLSGLASLEVEGSDLLDGSDMGPYLDRQRMDRGGINCALNCFYQKAFADGAAAMSVLCDSEGAAGYRDRADRLAAAIRESFWDAERGVFVDRRAQDVEQTGPSVAANTLPVLYGIAAEEQVDGAVDYVTDALLDNFVRTPPQQDSDCRCMPYFSFYPVEVLYRHGRAEAVEEFFRTCWGMLAERGAWTWWETFHGGSRCHAWSSCPTHYLSSRVLGVGFPEPGNPDVVRIEPHPGTLRWAAGFYPHPRGRIWVEWERKAGDVLLSYEAPPGVDITVKGVIVND